MKERFWGYCQRCGKNWSWKPFEHINVGMQGVDLCAQCATTFVQQQRNKRREAVRAEAMVGLLRAVPKSKKVVDVKAKGFSWTEYHASYQPVASSEVLLSLETGLPVKVKVGPSTAVFVQCPGRPEGQAHRYRLDQANHGVCRDCGATRDWPRPTFDIGWGDDGAMTWE